MKNRIFDTLVLALMCLLVSIYASKAHAQELMVGYLNANLRIVLSKDLCDPDDKTLGYKGVAQKLDEAGKVSILRGCWTNEPHQKLVRIVWIDSKKKEPDNFSIFDIDMFKPANEVR